MGVVASSRRGLLVGGALLLALSLRTSFTSNNPPIYASNLRRTVKDFGRSSFSLRPGALPSYTGWARPERTMAPFFHLVDLPLAVAVDSQVRLHLVCAGHARCTSAEPWFFVRAYGPSIITGVVVRAAAASSQYEVVFQPFDAGSYTVEIVLTYSDTPQLEAFPLSTNQTDEKYLYEGYHVEGSPFQLDVHGRERPAPQDLSLCTPDQLVETYSGRPAPRGRARWRVVDENNHQRHQTAITPTSTNITLEGYRESTNSLGVQLDYEYTDCRLMPAPSAKVNLFQCVREPLHIVLIGDSVLRLQRNIIQEYTKFNKHIRVSFVELYGGYFRTQLSTGPNVREFLSEATATSERRVVLFNTGLHDIHRLCGGNEMIADRRTYLKDEMPTSCVELYKIAMTELAEEIAALPATDVKIFQTTTAGWPKYGNYGVAWDPRYGQELPLDPAVIAHFNEIATTVVRQFPGLHVVDGFDVSLARPDHREVDAKSALGRKLSHPGQEVITTMVRIWSMLFLQQVCSSSS
jgi:hypothetical protein